MADGGVDGMALGEPDGSIDGFIVEGLELVG